MITPLMLLLSSINQDLAYDHPVDLTYLSRDDRALIVGEAERIGRVVSDSAKVIFTESRGGEPYADLDQVVGDSFVRIHPATAMLLTRVKEAYRVFQRMSAGAVAEAEDEDLGADEVVLRLEGNAKYVYVLVQQVMAKKSIDFDTKVAQLADIYKQITLTGDSQETSKAISFLRDRLELQSYQQFWCRLFTADLARYGLFQEDSIVQPEDLETVKKEIRLFGLYGFVNPKEMYEQFASARVSRKTSVKVEPEVVEFLSKVVRSGGGSLS